MCRRRPFKSDSLAPCPLHLSFHDFMSGGLLRSLASYRRHPLYQRSIVFCFPVSTIAASKDICESTYASLPRSNEGVRGYRRPNA